MGPYTNSAEFEEIPPSKLSGDVIDTVQEKYGIKVYFGRWLVKGYPKVFLIDIKSSQHRLDEWRGSLMGSFAVPGMPLVLNLPWLTRSHHTPYEYLLWLQGTLRQTTQSSLEIKWRCL